MPAFTAATSSRPEICTEIRDGEAVADCLKHAAALHFILERFAFRLGALEHRVGVAECVGQVPFERLWKRDVVDGFVAWAMGSSWLGLGLPRCLKHLGGPTILC